MSKLIKKGIQLPILAYKWLVSPVLGPSCRHTSTCCQYFLEAIEQWGVLKGLAIWLQRTYGFDPVALNKNKQSRALFIEELEEGTHILLQFKKRGGLLPVAVQESSSGQLLMLAYVDLEALRYSMANRKACFFSTSRQTYWVKGATSGNGLIIDKILVDCDQDALVYQVTLAKGGVCHTRDSKGVQRKACFYREIDLEKQRLYFLPQTK